MNLQLGLLLSKMGVEEVSSPLAEALATIRRDVRELMTELREVCAELRPPMLDTLGLSSALRALVEEWSNEENIPVRVDLPSDASLGFLSSETGLNLYRVAQESLSNVAKHAHADEVRLEMNCNPIDETVDLTIQDNGGGFELESARDLANQNHFGLVGMQERVALIGGELTIESAPGSGTTIHVIWKKPPAPPEVPSGVIRRPVAPAQGTAA